MTAYEILFLVTVVALAVWLTRTRHSQWTVQTMDGTEIGADTLEDAQAVATILRNDGHHGITIINPKGEIEWPTYP